MSAHSNNQLSVICIHLMMLGSLSLSPYYPFSLYYIHVVCTNRAVCMIRADCMINAVLHFHLV